MILLVPTSPEVPKIHSRQIWQGLVLVIILSLCYLETSGVLDADTAFVDNLYAVASDGNNGLKPGAEAYLQQRPLLKISPSPADWDLKRILFANFIHGSPIHLLLNLIGAFAGARICATFIPFLCSLSIFVLGGSFGIFMSLLLSSKGAAYVPHVGASGGIFALMGTYYIYNFRFRTRYFFWFPSRQRMVSLRTSSFFFLDAILLELVLSAAQFLPHRMDNVDHLAHVFGFASGMFLAIVLRTAQRWPGHLHTRSEFLYWSRFTTPGQIHPVLSPFQQWTELLEINPYNDRLKLKLYKLLFNRVNLLSDAQIALAFKFMSPTFIRLHTEECALFVKEVLSRDRSLSADWLGATPYDSIIRLAKVMTVPVEEQYLLIKLVVEYRKAQPGAAGVQRKLELLMVKLKDLMPKEAASVTNSGTLRDATSKRGTPPSRSNSSVSMTSSATSEPAASNSMPSMVPLQDENDDSENEDNSPQQKRSHSPRKTAKKVS